MEDKMKEPVVIRPTDALWQEYMERYDLPNYLVSPDLWNAQREAESVFARKDHLYVLLDASKVDRYGDHVMLTVIPKAYRWTYGDRVTVDVLGPSTMADVWLHNPYIGYYTQRVLTPYDVTVDVNNLEMKWKKRPEDAIGYRNRTAAYLANLGLYLFDNTPVYTVTEEEREWARAWFHHIEPATKIVGVQVRSAGNVKVYPYMKDVIDALSSLGKAVICLDARTIEDGSFLYSFRKMAALIERCDVVVALDSAVLHLAGALRKRVVGVFGNVDGKIMAEDYEKATVVQGKCTYERSRCWWEVDCVPGATYQEKEQGGPAECLKYLDSGEIVNAVRNHLGRPKKILAGMLTYNLLDMTKRAVASLRTWHNLELFVADNESTDGTHEWLVEQNIWFHPERTSVAGACNIALQRFLGGPYDYFLLLNNDVVLRRDCIDALVSCLERSGAFAATAIPMTSPPPWLIDTVAFQNNFWHETINIPPGSYSCTLFSRRCIEQVGLFDEQFAPRYLEDNDYTLRLRLTGGKFVQVHDAGYFHALGGVQKSNAEEGKKADAHWQSNVERFVKKWGVHPHRTTYASEIGLNGFLKQGLTFKEKMQLAVDAGFPDFTVDIVRMMGGIGDHIFLSVLPRAIKRHFPQAYVTMVCPSQYHEVYKNYPYVDRVSAFRMEADITIECTDMDFITETKEQEEIGRIVSNRAKIYLDLAGFYEDCILPDYIVSVEDKAWAVEAWPDNPMTHVQKKRIAVGSKTTNLLKTWPRMDEFIETLKKDYDVWVVDLMVDGEYVLTLQQAAALIDRADLVVSLDSAYSNMGGALGKPTIAIFGYRGGSVFAEMFPTMRVVQAACVCPPRVNGCDYNVACYPGDYHRFKEDFGSARCLETLSIEEVLKEVRIALG
jgi:ADP-heptose:LPS heptosyltransferase/GT2 family glycosyltransferase